MRESTSVFQIRTINWSKLDKRQVSMVDSRRSEGENHVLCFFFSELQNIFEIILFTAPSQNISRSTGKNINPRFRCKIKAFYIVSTEGGVRRVTVLAV